MHHLSRVDNAIAAMRRRALSLLAAVVFCVSGLFAAFTVTGASAHQNGCHAAHSCPSDHHTYIWYDANGQGWDCAEPGAAEYKPAIDTTKIIYAGLPYYCRVAGSVPHGGGVAGGATTGGRTGVGKTVLVHAKSKNSGCTRGPLPDRRCSPGAYYSALTKKVLCSASFHTSGIRNVPESEKHAVEVEYGMTPKGYGRTLEIDHIVSLELGGSNDISNLFPERAPGYHVKDRPREQAARTRLLRGDDAAYGATRHRRELGDALQAGLRDRADPLSRAGKAYPCGPRDRSGDSSESGPVGADDPDLDRRVARADACEEGELCSVW